MPSPCHMSKLLLHWKKHSMFQFLISILLLILSCRATYGGLTTVRFLSYEPADFVMTGNLSQDAQTVSKSHESQRKAAYRKVEFHMNAVEDLERRLGIQDRWTPGHAKYQKTWQYIHNPDFMRVVERLEGLVVQRLFELSKANLSGTGECFQIAASHY
jgi:hypothetical protein